MSQYTQHQIRFFAEQLLLKRPQDTAEGLASSMAGVKIDLNPHQVDAALFALQSPLSDGALLADEVGLGKTIEAGLVLAQCWAERKRKILLIVTASLRTQWRAELEEKFFINSEILESNNYNKSKRENPTCNPFEVQDAVVICSYNFASNKMEDIRRTQWDLVIMDEAHKLRNVYKRSNVMGNRLKEVLRKRKKLLLTATPLQNNLMELYGLVSLIDEKVFGDPDVFREMYVNVSNRDVRNQQLKLRLQNICKRTLRNQAQGYITPPFTNRIAITQSYNPSPDEEALYNGVSDYLQRDRLYAFPQGQRQLLMLVARKLLASSSMAIHGTLSTVIERLNLKLDDYRVQLNPSDFDDYDGIEELVDEEVGDNDCGATEVLEADFEGIKKEIEELQKYDALNESLMAYNALVSTLQKAQDDYIEKSEIAKTKRCEYETLNKAYLDEQAGILASELRDEQPCPVCGSTEHPAPAVLSGDAPTKVMLDAAKKTADTAETEMTTASNHASSLKGQSDTKRNEISTTATSLLGDVTFDEILTALNTALTVVKTEKAEIISALTEQEKRIARKKALDESIPIIEQGIATASEGLGKAKEQVAALTTQINADSKTKDERAAELKFKSEADAKAETVSLKNKQKGYEGALQAAQAVFDTTKAKVAATKTEIQTLTTQIADSKPLDLDAVTQEKKTVEDNQRTLNEANQIISTRKSANETALNSIVKTTKTISELETRYKWLKEISDTANGDVAGKEKIKLETYVQAAYFDRIVARANLRLLQMSNSQFELKRRGVSGKQGQSGLDLNVIDYYNGTERDAKTLSGGESFIAALSLALGLSDEIQENAGGIRLDSMFVDEGFDSLDDTRLSQAMQTLMSISQTNRLIGIISHVPGLDERIDRKIVVTKNRIGGSKTELIAN